MSERGSFVTQLMYCDKCFKKMGKVLLRKIHYGKYCGKLEGFKINGNIIGGFLGSVGPYTDTIMFKNQLFNKKNAPCHPVRVALIPDTEKAELVVVTPEGEVVDYDEFMKENPNFTFL